MCFDSKPHACLNGEAPTINPSDKEAELTKGIDGQESLRIDEVWVVSPLTSRALPPEALATHFEPAKVLLPELLTVEVISSGTIGPRKPKGTSEGLLEELLFVVMQFRSQKLTDYKEIPSFYNAFGKSYYKKFGPHLK